MKLSNKEISQILRVMCVASMVSSSSKKQMKKEKSIETTKFDWVISILF